MAETKSTSDIVGWERLHTEFPAATPELIAARALQERTDTKFVLSPQALRDVLARLHNDYAAICAPAHYRSLYFDTHDLALFHAHRRGRRVRYKVRIRHVVDRALSFLEIKGRKSAELTCKTRIDHKFGDDDLSAADQAFLCEQCHLSEPLEPAAWTEYERLTLLGLSSDERVTIDSAIRFESAGATQSLGGVVLIEVKQWPYSRATPIMMALRAAGIRPASPSKYCLAIVSTRPAQRHNRFLPILKVIEGLQHA